jgi:hypothetical protein
MNITPVLLSHLLLARLSTTTTSNGATNTHFLGRRAAIAEVSNIR